MARNHISFDDMELGILKVALEDFVLRSHEAARKFEGQDQKEDYPAAYRRQANKASEMVKRLKQGYTGLREAK